MQLAEQVSKSLAWRTLNSFAIVLMNAIFIMVMARLIDKSIHGVFAILNAMVMFITFFAEAGTGAALIQRKTVEAGHKNVAILTTMCLGIFFYGLLFFSSGALSAFYEGKITTSEINWIGINFLIVSLRITPFSLLIKQFSFKKLFLADLISYFIGNMIVGIYLATQGYGIWAFIYGLLTTNIINTALIIYYYPLRFGFKFSVQDFRDILSFGLPFTLVRILSYATNQVDKLLLGKFIPTTSLAIYEKGFFLSYLPVKVSGNSIDSVLFSYFSKIQDNDEKRNSIFVKIYIIFFSLMLFLTFTMYSLAEVIVLFALGENWLDVVSILQIFILSIPFFSIVKLVDILVRATNNLNYSIVAKSIYVGLLIISVLVFRNASIKTISLAVFSSTLIYSVLMMNVSLMIQKKSWWAMVKEFLAIKYFILYCFVKCLFLNIVLRDAIDNAFISVPLILLIDVVVLGYTFLKIPAFYGEGNLHLIKQVGKILTAKFNFTKR